MHKVLLALSFNGSVLSDSKSSWQEPDQGRAQGEQLLPTTLSSLLGAERSEDGERLQLFFHNYPLPAMLVYVKPLVHLCYKSAL